MVVGPDRFDEILAQVNERLAQANEDGTLHQALSLLGLQGLLDVDDDLDLGAADPCYGDILVVGNSSVKTDTLQAIGRDCGYDKARFHFIAYDEVTNFNFGNIRNSMSYAAIMCGPVPHKAGGMGGTSSILEEMRHPENGFPPLSEMRESGGTGELKITKQTFRAAIADLETRGAIKPNT